MLDVHGVEADDRGVKANIGFGYLVAPVIWPWTRAQVFFDLIQCLEEREEIPFVGFLCRSESSLVNTVVDKVVCPFVMLINTLPQALRIQHNILFHPRKIIKFCVHHTDNVGAFVGDDFVMKSVVQGWNGKAAGILRIDGKVDVL